MTGSQDAFEKTPPAWRDLDTLTVEEAAAILRISRNTAYAAIHTGELPGAWFGKRFLVSVRRLKQLIDGENQPRRQLLEGSEVCRRS
jgi:excisionase family DNA binding protein